MPDAPQSRTPQDSSGRPFPVVPEGVGCADLVDAMGRVHGHRADLLPLTSPTPERPLFGPAATIAYLPFRDDFAEGNRLGFAGWFYRAVGEEPRGRVLVLSSGGYPDASHGGATKLSRLANHGLAGLLTDGRLRDLDELGASGLSVWCSGAATRWGGDTVAPYAADVPVQVGGVTVTPGDFVYADRSGAVVIPAVSLDRVLAEARQIRETDLGFLASIREEDPEALRRGEDSSTET
ncbi:RraA family protein [Nocardiopsis valliformis]|uniref:RraA family protein n=1 Tax=Nocardiopsis valliformis TaxID=239974 RepID=UPI000477A496|nr:RraA family protein [Nocardiopsis valliformis]